MRPMINPKFLDELSQKVLDALPQGLDHLGNDLRANLRLALSSALKDMDLVSREEFDVQAAVLARTREKLAGLEETVAALEQSTSA
jgi:ubiquinone biosynthesis accessory factor UbiK